jgi:hypothetical protein
VKWLWIELLRKRRDLCFLDPACAVYAPLSHVQVVEEKSLPAFA